MVKTTPQNILLPKHITPIHYKIFLQPDLDNFVFQGEEEIEINITKTTNVLILHSAEIEVFSAHLKFGEKEQVASAITYDDEAETVSFTFDKKIPKGVSVVIIKFAGILNNKMRGFYRSKYTHDGREYHMGVTQFESTDARRAFPCFDEPSQKATFDVSLKVPQDRTVISNTLEEEVIEHEGGYKVVRFEKSPKMSSYLLAFIIGHFEYVETKTKEGVLVRVYVTPGKKEQARFALDCAAKLMSFYNNYFGIDYPLPTMDLIAIPDFANGAMENWGAVTYRETALLVDDETSSLHTKQWVALIIAHELAHQWFGNLVTMKWWTHLWLNEGFASFMEYLAVDSLFPEWHVWTQFVYTEQARALSLDGLASTHSIEIPVHHPGEISEIFDAVSYSKGASVIRMIESYVGEKNFQKGLQLYLKTHQYSNAETNDLWMALEKVSKKPVGKIMKNWTSQPGYPLVNASVQGNDLLLEQSRYFSSPLVEKQKTSSWLIPLKIISDSSKKPVTTLIDKKKLVLTGFDNSNWIKVNADETSFVRVKYTRANLQSLQKPIKSRDEKLSEEARFALVRDVFALVESGDLPTDVALDFASSYKEEESYIVWAEIVSHLLELKTLLYATKAYESYCLYAKNLLKEIGKGVGWSKKPKESHSATLLRSNVLYALGTLGEESVINQARKLFENSLLGKKIDSDLRGLTYALVAENGGREEFEKLKKIYTDSQSEEEKDRALRAISSFTDIALLKEVLSLTFSTQVRSQDAFKAIYLLASNPIAIDLTWDYVKENWESIQERFAGGHLFSRFVSPFSKFTSRVKADNIDEFFSKNKAPGLERTVAQTVEKIRSNADLLRRDLPKIELFLKNC